MFIASFLESLEGLNDVINIHNKDSIQSVTPVLLGFGTAGVSVNIAERNSSWCYVHRLELACKDSFTSDSFSRNASSAKGGMPGF